MTFTVEAIYENGVLTLTQPLPLKDQERVQITIQGKTNWVEETAGIIGWKGSQERSSWQVTPATDGSWLGRWIGRWLTSKNRLPQLGRT